MRGMTDIWSRGGWAALALAWTAALGGNVMAQAPEQAPAAAPAGSETGKLVALNFVDAQLDQALDFYASMTGRTVLKQPGLAATITVKAQGRLTREEALTALEAVLAMNNISLVPMGEKFWKAVPTAQARQEAMGISNQIPEKGFAETDALVSQVIRLQHMEVAEAQPVIQSFLHAYGKIQPLERANALLVTDTSANLQRILEIMEFLDQPIADKMETRIIPLQHAEADKIAARLNEIIADSQAQQERPRIVAAPAAAAPAAPPGVIRPPRGGGEAAAGGGDTAAERGIVRGKVKIISDDRTNLLIILSRPENFVFFEQIVAALDKEVEPEVSVKVINLEFAVAEEVATILNDLIGAATQKSSGETPAPANRAQPANETEARSQALRDFVAQRLQRTAATAGDAAAVSEGLGKLSPHTRILADKRSNALLLMGRRQDLDALERDIIRKLDVMLAQVLIEAVILEVGLSDSLKYGVDWLQRSITYYNQTRPGGGVNVNTPVFSFAGGQQMGESSRFQDAGGLTARDTALTAGGLTYYLTFFDLSLDAVLSMAAGSSDARILSTPVIMTTDNKEASILVGERRPVVSSSSTTSAGEQRSTYEYTDIGVNLKVTPRINPQRNVIMEVEQTADNVGDFEVIDGNRVPIITKRELKAQISVANRATVVLGGLVSTDKRKTRAKVPLLGDIPLLGILFRSDNISNARRELLVFLTPYVLLTPEEARRETERLHTNSASLKTTWHRGWSDSSLLYSNGVSPRAEEIRLRSAAGAPVVPPAATNAPTDAPTAKPAAEPSAIPVPPQ